MTLGLKKQRGYLLVTVVMGLFLLASIALVLNHDSSISANTTSKELETARAEYVAQAGMQHALWRASENSCLGDVTIPLTALGNDEYNATVTGAAAGTMHKLSADQDAWIRSDDVTRNNGTTGDQHIRFESGKTEHALTRFDLTSLPAKAQISSATAWFYITPSGPGGGAHPEGPVAVHRVTEDWTETGATWENMNGQFESSILATIPAQPNDNVWVGINLTASVQAWVNGQPNYGILFASTAEGVHGKYTSREGAGNEQPYIEVVVGSGQASPVMIEATGTLANGNTRTLQRSGAVALQPPASIMFQPGPLAGVDAYIWEANKTTNYGTDDETWVSQSSNNTSLSLLKFPTEGIPSGSRILSAILSLHHRSGNNSDVPVAAHRITANWKEDSVTWNQRKSGKAWSSAGGDIDPTIIATVDVGPQTFNRYEWEIAPLVQGWVNGDFKNHGVALATAMAGSIGERFDTSDHSDPARRPSLTITYACECGNVCMVPQGSGNVLIVIGDPPSNPAAVDAAIRERFESWGYAVSFIQDDDSQGNYDSAMSANDVVYISDTVSSNNIGLKLTKTGIGVVSQKGNHNLELDIADGKGQVVGRTVNVSDASHYITQPFPETKLDIYDADMEILTMPVTKAAGLQTLVDVAGIGSLVAVEKGDPDLSGSPIAGRRVVLPLGRVEFLNWDYVNNNGQLLVQRSLAWAMNIKSGARILLVVGISNSLQSRDTGRRDLFESWGYDVTIIDDGATQAEFDAELALNDVVYVGGTVVAGNLDTKLNATTIGVVNEVAGQLDDYGFHGNTIANTVTSNQFTATDAGHYITEPFTGSGVTHFTTSLNMPVASAPLAPNLGKVASIGTLTWAIPVLDTGAQRWDGAPSAGRRVHLPFGEAETNQLTADGLTLLERTIEWAGGAGTGNNVLLVVGDPANLTPEQVDKKELIEGWGHNVTLIATAEPQAAFETAADTVDVVYIPELGAGPMGELDTKADNLPQGVITEEARRAIKLGSFLLLPFVDTTSINIVDNTHYITETLPTGSVELSTSTQSFWKLGGTLAPDLHILGELTGGVPGLAYVDVGEIVSDGNPAAGRRVKLPWGSYNFDVNLLTNEGIEIMRRAIVWGAVDTSPTGPVAHWKLDDGTGTTAIDSVGGNHGTLDGYPSWTVGAIGDALDFDGTGDIVVTDSAFTPPPVGTVSFWMQVSGSPATHGRILGLHDTWEIRHVTTGTPDGIPYGLVFDLGVTGVNTEFVTTTTVDSPGHWYHVAAAYDTITDAYAVYIDGAAHKSGTYPSALSVPAADLLTLGTRTGSTQYFDGILDDIRVYDSMLSAAEIGDLYAAGPGGGGSGGGVGCYADDFESDTYSGSSGSIDWPTNWVEFGDDNNSSSGDERIQSESGDLALRVRDNNGGGEGVYRDVDLSGFAAATLTLEYRRHNLDTESDWVALQVSNDGGDTWNLLGEFHGPGSDVNYQTYSHAIGSPLTATTRIRLLTSPTMGGTDAVYFDNVEICDE